jgi:hypothetical protein
MATRVAGRPRMRMCFHRQVTSRHKHAAKAIITRKTLCDGAENINELARFRSASGLQFSVKKSLSCFDFCSATIWHIL